MKWKNIRKVEINYVCQEYIEHIARGISSTSVPPELCLCDTKVDAAVKEMFRTKNITVCDSGKQDSMTFE